MSTIAEDVVSYEELSRVRNEGTDYVTIIFDVWKGDRDDPAVSIYRYLALFKVEEVPEALLFRDRYYGFDHDRAQTPVVWESMGEVKEAVKEAQQHKAQYDRLADGSVGYAYGVNNTYKELYTRFLDAIDVLHENPDDQEAWKTVGEWRSYMAKLHEK